MFCDGHVIVGPVVFTLWYRLLNCLTPEIIIWGVKLSQPCFLKLYFSNINVFIYYVLYFVRVVFESHLFADQQETSTNEVDG